MADHDHSYKLLFSHAQMVRDLLTGFVHEEWLEQLDFESLEKVAGSYISDDLRERADDIVWRARWGKEWLYIYLLLEFQSTVEWYMALRMLVYDGLLYQDLLRSGQVPHGELLPSVLPVVLYRGARKWNAPKEMESLIQAGPKALEPYRPQFRYMLIDEGRYRNSELAAQRNLVAALFRLENSRNYAEIQGVLTSLLEWLKSPEQHSLRRAFTVWVGRVILARLPGGESAAAVEDLEEMRVMLEDRFEEWAEEFKQKGLLEGRQEGRQEGEARLLERQLRKRFGELPEWVLPRLRQAEPEQLERWGERLLEVDSLASLFEAERH